MNEKPFNRAENRFFTELIILRNTMFQGSDAVKERLEPFKGAWRDLKLMEKLAEKIQECLSATLPPEKLLKYQKLVKHGKIYLDFPGASPKDDHILVSAKNAAFLAEYAIKGECALCMKDGREVKRCPLRDALLSIAPPTKVSEIGCEYRSVAGDLLSGREVSL